jgi:enoyl-CoA hydratase/carnithine racemase
MMCDLVLAADDAQVGQPEISLGCYPPVAVAYLPGAIGFHKASEMVLLGEPVSAAEAERLGIINKVVSREKLTECVDTYVDKLLTRSSAILALTKRALREGAGRHFEEALDHAQELYVRELVRTEDMVEGIRAFLEKRAPAWKNR